MATVRFTLDPANPPTMSAEDLARLDALTDEELTANALSDPDNPPLTDEELDRMRAVGLVRLARSMTGMSQPQFAQAYHFSLGRLRDLEQGRTTPDSAVLAYLELIRRDPEAVRRALEDAAA
jgi:putative transcriptional regulator